MVVHLEDLLNDDDDKEEDDNNEVEDNNKDDNKDKGVSALGLDRDLWFSQGQQTRPNQTILNNSRILAQIRAISCRFAQSCAG